MLKIMMLSLSLAICAWSVIGCGGPNKEDIALEVAQQWVDASIDRVSGAVVDVVAGEYPALANIATAVVAEQVQKNLVWEYSTPRGESGDRYSLIATATADFEIKVPLLDDKAYSISAPFDLVVDTTARSVVDWSLILGDVRITENR